MLSDVFSRVSSVTVAAPAQQRSQKPDFYRAACNADAV